MGRVYRKMNNTHSLPTFRVLSVRHLLWATHGEPRQIRKLLLPKNSDTFHTKQSLHLLSYTYSSCSPFLILWGVGVCTLHSGILTDTSVYVPTLLARLFAFHHQCSVNFSAIAMRLPIPPPPLEQGYYSIDRVSCNRH